MGIYLSSPKTEKFSEDGENERIRFGVSAMQGWRSSMEDAHAAILKLDDNTSFFGVYDGHGGKVVSKFCAKHLHLQVLRSEAYARGDLPQCLQKAYLRMDDMMRSARGWKELSILNGDKISKLSSFFDGFISSRNSESKASSTGTSDRNADEWTFQQGSDLDFEGPTCGSTAVVALLRNAEIVVANAGDSRCVLSRKGKAYDLSQDHKPELQNEKERILEAGGFIHAGRVNGSLNLARAIGDVEFKKNKYLPPQRQIVTAWPDVKTVGLSVDDEFLILACDGIWDVMSSQGVVDFVHEHIHEAASVSAVCEKLLDHCLAPSTTFGEGCDNMTAIIVQIKNPSAQVKDSEKGISNADTS
eukprot:c27886_g1_i5 orf=1148-2221(+)